MECGRPQGGDQKQMSGRGGSRGPAVRLELSNGVLARLAFSLRGDQGKAAYFPERAVRGEVKRTRNAWLSGLPAPSECCSLGMCWKSGLQLLLKLTKTGAPTNITAQGPSTLGRTLCPSKRASPQASVPAASTTALVRSRPCGLGIRPEHSRSDKGGRVPTPRPWVL